jgi:hypothetical protein
MRNFTSLPTDLQEQLREYLATDDFPKAKELYDTWMHDSSFA